MNYWDSGDTSRNVARVLFGKFTRADRSEHICSVRNVSIDGAEFTSSTLPAFGEALVANLEHFGRIDSRAGSATGDGFKVQWDIHPDDRVPFLSKLTWLDDYYSGRTADSRQHHRRQVDNMRSAITLLDGRRFPCEIRDISMSGAGIIISGLAATGLVTLHGTAAWGWLLFALLAITLAAAVWRIFQVRNSLAAPVVAAATAVPVNASPPPPAHEGLGLLTAAYSLAGFGYIITATFLPVIARQTLPPSPWLDLFWPLFGLGVSTGALITVRLPMQLDRRHLLMGCYAMQATGVLLGVWWPTLAGFALGSLLLGLPFTAITLFAMQEARRLRPHGASALIGLLTAAYINLAWVGLGEKMAQWFSLEAEPTVWVSFVLSMLALGFILRKG